MNLVFGPSILCLVLSFTITYFLLTNQNQISDGGEYLKFQYVAIVRYVIRDRVEYTELGSIISPIWVLTYHNDEIYYQYADVTVGAGYMTKTYKINSTIRSPDGYNIVLHKTEKMQFNVAVHAIQLIDSAPTSFDSFDENFITIANANKAIQNGKRFQQEKVIILKTNEFWNQLATDLLIYINAHNLMADEMFSGQPLVAYPSNGKPILIGLYFNTLRQEEASFSFASIKFIRNWIRQETNI